MAFPKVMRGERQCGSALGSPAGEGCDTGRAGLCVPGLAPSHALYEQEMGCSLQAWWYPRSQCSQCSQQPALPSFVVASRRDVKSWHKPWQQLCLPAGAGHPAGPHPGMVATEGKPRLRTPEQGRAARVPPACRGARAMPPAWLQTLRVPPRPSSGYGPCLQTGVTTVSPWCHVSPPVPEQCWWRCLP